MKNKNIFRVLFLAVLSLSACGSKSEDKKNEWEIGKTNPSSLKAKLEGSTLYINGVGEMMSFASAKDTPWYASNKNIKSIKIDEGVTSLGNNAFVALPVRTLIIPKSVTLVEERAINDETEIYLMNNDLELDLYFIPYVYYYSELPPETNDIYWQSDFEKVDVTTYLKEDEEIDYWHLVDNEISVWTKQKVLFIGNSFTYRNGVIDHSSGVPGIFNDIATDLGYYVETYSITGPGWYLDAHANEKDTCGKQVDALLKAVPDFDHIVLQEQSVNPFENYNRFLNGVTALKNKIEATQDNAKIHLYETWGSPYSANERKITINEMEMKLRKAYTDAGEALDLDVTYVGRAFSDVYTHHPDIYLWASDNRHQGYTGAYLSAATHVCKMLDADVRDTEFNNNTKYNAPKLSDEVLDVLRQAAYDSAHDIIHDEKEATPTAVSYDLEVAVWGRWISEDAFTTFFNGFLAYCDSNSVSKTGLHFTYYSGPNTSDPYYYIASFSSLAKQNNSDIVFPCATNLNTQNDSAYKGDTMTITALGININGREDRCIAKINEKEITNTFYNYTLSDEGKSLLDPSFKA